MKYQRELDEITQLVRAAQRSEDAQSRTVIYLKQHFNHYNWVGIFRLQGKELVLGPFQGQTPAKFSRIAVGQGICGTAAVTMRTEVVPDVEADARYLLCFAETRSEIVVPIIRDGRLWGEIAIDSNQPDAFTADDARFLEAVAGLLAERV
uniref:GAF domain-containing protein n=1 Tax=candidate division WOR-3 bacterium TaxID=2052148 RepID=A0A7C4G9T7_UNCW3